DGPVDAPRHHLTPGHPDVATGDDHGCRGSAGGDRRAGAGGESVVDAAGRVRSSVGNQLVEVAVRPQDPPTADRPCPAVPTRAVSGVETAGADVVLECHWSLGHSESWSR